VSSSKYIVLSLIKQQNISLHVSSEIIDATMRLPYKIEATGILMNATTMHKMIRVMVNDVEFYVDTHAVTRKDYVGLNAAPTIS